MVLNRKTPIFIATLLIAISCGQAKDLKSSNPSKAGFDEERLKRIDTMIQGCHECKHFRKFLPPEATVKAIQSNISKLHHQRALS